MFVLKILETISGEKPKDGENILLPSELSKKLSILNGKTIAETQKGTYVVSHKWNGEKKWSDED